MKVTDPARESPLRALPRSAHESARGTPRPLSLDPAKGYHPLVATRADTGEIVHARVRKGSVGSGRGARWFVREVAGLVRRAGATGEIMLRADSGLWSTRS